MPHVEVLDETLRDGQQSLWGMRMQAGMALPVAGTLDRTGFRVIDATGSSFMEVLVKYSARTRGRGSTSYAVRSGERRCARVCAATPRCRSASHPTR
jgi:isopropylmalate/homocitrate/citramalate synthase